MPTRELAAPPPLTGLYARAALTGLLPGGGDGRLPETELVVRDVPVDVGHLAAYARVCGFTLGDRLPATYLHVLAFPMAVQLMAERDFPFALPGLVHVGNRIVQHRPVAVTEAVTLAMRLEGLRDHPKGRQFDAVAEASVDGATVWTATSTFLRRGGGGSGAPEDATPSENDGTRSGDEGETSGGTDRSEDDPMVPEPSATWHVPADTGRRYAAVSGDRNPIHLHPLTARLFGFPRQIAHGMWSKARCLAALEGRLPDAYEVEATFRKPVVLPAEVGFGLREREGGWTFALVDPRRRRPHLTGTLSPR